MVFNVIFNIDIANIDIVLIITFFFNERAVRYRRSRYRLYVDCIAQSRTKCETGNSQIYCNSIYNTSNSTEQKTLKSLKSNIYYTHLKYCMPIDTPVLTYVGCMQTLMC